MGTKSEGFISSQHIMVDPIDAAGPQFAFAATLARHANDMLDQARATGERGDWDNWRAARAAFATEVARWRGIGERVLARGHVADVVSHLDAAGDPDTSTDEGAAYWADVQQAASLGVPNALGIQR